MARTTDLHTERQLRQAGWLTEFHRVPGHYEIVGNEVVDQWANAGAAGA
jgi:ribonuclease HI